MAVTAPRSSHPLSSSAVVSSPSSIFVRHPQPPPLYIEEHVNAAAAAAAATPVAVAPSTNGATPVGVIPRVVPAPTPTPHGAVPLKGVHKFDSWDSSAAQTLANELNQQMSAPDPLFIDRPMPTLPSPMYLKAGEDPLPLRKQYESRMSLHFHGLPWAPWPSSTSDRLYAYRGNMLGSYPLQDAPDDSLHMIHPGRMESPMVVGRRTGGHGHAANGQGMRRRRGHGPQLSSQDGRRLAALLAQFANESKMGNGNGAASIPSAATPTTSATTTATATADTQTDKDVTPSSVPASFQTAMSDLYQQAIGGVKRLFDMSPSSATSSDASASVAAPLMDVTNDDSNALYADSVKRKRVLKMKRHKLKKRAKKERNKNIGAK